MEPSGIDPLIRTGADRDVAAEVTSARKTLDRARSALDRAVAALPEVDGDEAMATPSLLLLLFGAVRAKEQLSQLEALEAGEPARQPSLMA
jgi:hypothetical protein